MNVFDQLPKTIKKTVRYILQDVQSVERLEEIQRILNTYINKRKRKLQEQNKVV